MNRQSGFTLIELVVVIVILGVLAATALPRFVNIGSDARIAAVNGIAGAVRSSVALVQAKYQVLGLTAAGPVNIDGTTIVNVGVGGIPTSAADGIGAALNLQGGITPNYTAASATFFPTGGNATTCVATYTPDGLVAVTITGC